MIPDIVYCQRPTGPLALDLYLPESVSARALILFAHGGGFTRGARDTPDTRAMAARLNSAGFAMASVSYRLGGGFADLPESYHKPVRQNRRATIQAGLTLKPRLFGAAFEVARQDIGEALSYLRAHLASWQIESDRVGFLGISAGAIAGLSLAYPPENLPSPARPDALFALSGAMVQPWRLHRDGPPCLMLNSVFDRIIPPENAARVAATAKACDAPVTALTCQRKGHNAPVIALNEDSDETGTPYWEQMVGFFARSLSPSCAGA